MATAVEMALRAIFRDPNQSTAVTYTPGGGTSRAIRAIVRRPETQTGLAPFMGGKAEIPAQQAWVLMSDVAGPKTGDMLTLPNGQQFKVVGKTPDAMDFYWSLDLERQRP